LLGAVAAITFAGAMAASAATFSVIGSGPTPFPPAGTAPGNYSLPLPSPLPTEVYAFSNGQSGVGVDMNGVGLSLSKKSKLVFTYLGSDSAFRNASFALGSSLFNNQTATAGDKAVRDALGGLLDLLFTTNGGPSKPNGAIENGTGVGSVGLSLGFSISADGKTAYAFFDDGGSTKGLPKSIIDLDYDDLAFQISAVPVPAGGLLLISGLGALAVARRRKQA
jgi:hypothetical protein